MPAAALPQICPLLRQPKYMVDPLVGPVVDPMVDPLVDPVVDPVAALW